MSGFTIGSYGLEYFLFGLSVMMILSIISCKASSWFGVPSLLLFLGIGMLAGSEGPGRIEFNNYSLAYVIGSISLVFILFDGGMGTSWKRVRPVAKIGISLSTLGVLFTCLTIGVFCHYFFGMPWLESFLLGAIVSSTDAAAVFSILRSKNLALKGKLKETLELEAGSNDPMAIFLTIGLLQMFIDPTSGPTDFLTSFLLQGAIGIFFGLSAGRATVWFFNNIKIDYDGLYAVLLVSLVILIFSITSLLYGSGFLAVYIMGVVIGSSNILRKQSLTIFHDGIAWMAQICLFLVLGLLVTPSKLLDVWKEGILLATFMMIWARPLSVLFAAPKSPFTKRERIFISWVGLRGAAPILLAILPWASGYQNAEYLFNLVFFVVLFSVFLQAPTIPWLAQKLDLIKSDDEDIQYAPTFLPKGFVTINLIVCPNALAIDKKTVDLTLPAGVLLISLERQGFFSVPKGDTIYQAQDKITALARPSSIAELKDIFGKEAIN